MTSRFHLHPRSQLPSAAVAVLNTVLTRHVKEGQSELRVSWTISFPWQPSTNRKANLQIDSPLDHTLANGRSQAVSAQYSFFFRILTATVKLKYVKHGQQCESYFRRTPPAGLRCNYIPAAQQTLSYPERRGCAFLYLHSVCTARLKQFRLSTLAQGQCLARESNRQPPNCEPGSLPTMQRA